MSTANCTSKPLDLGQGLVAEARYIDGVLEGVYYEHACVGGKMSPGWIPVAQRQDAHHWQLVSEEPLTVSPSLLCPLCKHHGFIRGGKWIPA